MSLFSIPAAQVVAAAVEAALEAAEEAARAARGAAFDPEMWALDMTALELCRELAFGLDAAPDDVWHALCNVPPSLTCLLDSPEGWGVLANHVALHLGYGPIRYRPQVH